MMYTVADPRSRGVAGSLAVSLVMGGCFSGASHLICAGQRRGTMALAGAWDVLGSRRGRVWIGIGVRRREKSGSRRWLKSLG